MPLISGVISLAAAGCSLAPGQSLPTEDLEVLSLPDLEPITLGGGRLRVSATTGVIGDVVARVGGEAIELTVLMGPGQDPHSFEPGARELAVVAESQAIFVNGWGLEEALVDDLERIGQDSLVIPISAGIEPLPSDPGGNGSHENGVDPDHAQHSGPDPHVWFSLRNVMQWVDNVRRVLSGLDPANADAYERNAAAFLAELEALEAYAESQFAGIPEGRRVLVTNHISLSYMARDYDLELIGTVIPSASTLAEPSANDLASLVERMAAHDLCTIFTDTTVSDTLARTVAAELEGCDAIKVIPLYTGSLGPAGGGADNFLGMFRSNVDAIVEGLK